MNPRLLGFISFNMESNAERRVLQIKKQVMKNHGNKRKRRRGYRLCPHNRKRGRDNITKISKLSSERKWIILNKNY